MIQFSRRRILHLAAGTAALPFFSRTARLQGYPTGPVRIIVGFPAGGPSDTLGRLVAKWLSERLGQQFTVENRPGLAGNTATENVIRSAPDGNTLLMISTPNAINATLYNNLKFDITRDIAPIAGVMRAPNIMAVAPSLRIKTVPEFIAYTKAHPNKIKMASVGIATRLSGELFKMMTGLNFSYLGSPSVVDMLAGLFRAQTQVIFDSLSSSLEYVRTKKLLPLAVTTASRSDALPEVPSIGDFVSGYEASAWFGLGAPRDTSTEIADLLNREINLGLAHPILKARLADLAGVPIFGTATEFGALLTEETEKWRKVITFSGIKPN
jgi:tripartite-type tricarboxylate transporter receptor subunit TctC